MAVDFAPTDTPVLTATAPGSYVEILKAAKADGQEYVAPIASEAEGASVIKALVRDAAAADVGLTKRLITLDEGGFEVRFRAGEKRKRTPKAESNGSEAAAGE